MMFDGINKMENLVLHNIMINHSYQIGIINECFIIHIELFKRQKEMRIEIHPLQVPADCPFYMIIFSTPKWIDRIVCDHVENRFLLYPTGFPSILILLLFFHLNLIQFLLRVNRIDTYKYFNWVRLSQIIPTTQK